MVDPTRKKTTHYIHRTSYRFQEQIVGFFVLTAMAILVAMFVAQIKSQNLFEEYFIIHGRLKSAEGLSRETLVQVSGFEVGHVADIEITENNNILLTMNIKRRYHKLLREDSRVKVRGLSAAIIGKSVIELTAGSPELPLIQEGVTLEIQESLSMETITDEVTKTIKTLNGVINTISAIVDAVEPDKLTATLSGIQDMSKNLSEISTQMKSPDGPFGAIVYDGKTAQNIKHGLVNLRTSTENIQAASENIKTSTATFKESSKDLDQLIDDLNIALKKIPKMLENINGVIHEAQQTVKATQQVWPISTTIETTPSQTIIGPAPASE